MKYHFNININMIVAVARHHVIGSEGRIPWHFPEDLAYFKRLTTSHVLLMGRRTYEEIGAPLPDRLNLVISRHRHFSGQNLYTMPTPEDAIAFAQTVRFSPEVFLCGGQEIYQWGMRHANRIYLTEIDRTYPGDRFFPEISPSQFREIRRTPGETPGLTFCVYERI